MIAHHLGSALSTSYRTFLRNSAGAIISPWHDVPLYVDESRNIVNMVVEIPRWTNAKLEIDTKAHGSPIKQDVKNGKVRFVKNMFPYKGYILNYGAFPQTWEDPSHVDERTGFKGDNDPVDVCDISTFAKSEVGDVVQVKVLGVFAMIDEGETDWKIIGINIKDPLSEQLHDIEDVEAHMPGLLNATHDWFTNYKIADGKPKNEFAFGGKCQNAAFAMNVIRQTHGFYNRVVRKEVPYNGELVFFTTPEHGEEVFQQFSNESKEPSVPPQDLDLWHFGHITKN